MEDVEADEAIWDVKGSLSYLLPSFLIICAQLLERNAQKRRTRALVVGPETETVEAFWGD